MLGFHMMHQNARDRVFPLTLANRVGTLLMFAVRNIFSQPERLRATMRDLAAAGSPAMARRNAGSVGLSGPRRRRQHGAGCRLSFCAARARRRCRAVRHRQSRSICAPISPRSSSRLCRIPTAGSSRPFSVSSLAWGWTRRTSRGRALRPPADECVRSLFPEGRDAFGVVGGHVQLRLHHAPISMVVFKAGPHGRVKQFYGHHLAGDHGRPADHAAGRPSGRHLPRSRGLGPVQHDFCALMATHEDRQLQVSRFNPVCEVHFIQPRNALVVGSSTGKKNSMRISSRLTSRGVPSVAIVVNNESEVPSRWKWIGSTGL